MVKLIKKILLILLLLIICIITFFGKKLYSFIQKNKSEIKKYTKGFCRVLKEEIGK